jgi:hypothetical protein
MRGILFVVLLTALVLCGWGCIAQPDPFRPGEPGAGVPSAHNPIDTLGGQLGWLSWICLLIGIGGIIASYVPTFGEFVPRKSAVIAFCVGIGLAFVRAWVETLGKPLVWISFALTVIGIILALYPYAAGLVHYVKSVRRNQPGSDLVGDDGSDSAAGPAATAVKP